MESTIAAAAASEPTVIVYRCSACHEKFTSRDQVRDHCATEFHSYNVMRKVQGLPPITPSEFQRIETENEDSDEEVRQPKYRCQICRKTFGTPQTLDSHLRSKKHLLAKQAAAEKQQQMPSGESSGTKKSKKSKSATTVTATTTAITTATATTTVSSVAVTLPTITTTTAAATSSSTSNGTSSSSSCNSSASPAEPPDATLFCLFCDVRSATRHKNLRHMFEIHDFRLPLWELITNERGLLEYLHRKIKSGLCLYCGERSKTFHSVTGLRRHMFAKDHAQINWMEDAAEYTEFYKLPESVAWKVQSDDFGEGFLPDGRKIACRTLDDSAAFIRSLNSRMERAAVSSNSNTALVLSGARGPTSQLQVRPFSQGSALTKRQLMTSKADRLQVSRSAAEKLNFRFSVLKKFQKDRQKEQRESAYTSLKVATDHNRAMFHGFMLY